ncbi:hypothetical protein PAPYR_9723 [Paratrimastix pyriformis]|uniref:Uncharacterized protein n=1 Tax=Paratrimastix pyriformis TaxID=342808 RepID=A0ABQ8U9B0_9EUKA|nr:hypothetical protein PAPYR_9723 [Paratrimastix pyriformis]
MIIFQLFMMFVCSLTNHPSEEVSRPQNPADGFSRLPVELIPLLVETSDCPTVTYVQLLSLSCTLRAAIRGTARTLSFDDDVVLYDQSPMPDPSLEALTALLAPCKSLTEFSLGSWSIPLFAYGTEAACTAWAEEAVPRSLAVLRIHASMKALLPALLDGGYLSGLAELTIASSTSADAIADEARGALLPLLVAGCPHLRSLQFPGSASLDLAALVPLAKTLEHLSLSKVTLPASSDLLRHCGDRLKRLSLTRTDALTLRTLTQRCRLSHLTIEDSSSEDLFQGSSEHLHCLESLDAPLCSDALSRLLAANQATLRSLGFLCWHASNPVELLPPALVDRLEHLEIRNSMYLFSHPLHIASSHLRRLRLGSLVLPSFAGVSLACPALEELSLPGHRYLAHPYSLTLHCPRLRRLQCCESLFPEVIYPTLLPWMEDLIGQLQAGSPLLCQLGTVWISRPAVLAGLLSLGSLARLGTTLVLLDQDAAAGSFPDDPLVLQLPPSLRRLTAHVMTQNGRRLPGEVRLIGPRLRSLSLNVHRGDDDNSGSSGSGQPKPTGPPPPLPELRLALHCPALAGLRYTGSAACPSLSGPEEGTPPLPLQTLQLAQIPGLRSDLAAFLAGLPRLTELALSITPHEWPEVALTLACPHLQQLTLHLRSPDGRTRLCAVTLDCPQLVDCRLHPCLYLRRFALVRPAPRLIHLHLSQANKWCRQVVPRFPGSTSLTGPLSQPREGRATNDHHPHLLDGGAGAG